jgi:hypothetical protein
MRAATVGVGTTDEVVTGGTKGARARDDATAAAAGAGGTVG